MKFKIGKLYRWKYPELQHYPLEIWNEIELQKPVFFGEIFLFVGELENKNKQERVPVLLDKDGTLIELLYFEHHYLEEVDF